MTTDRNCSTCKYGHLDSHLDPCRPCLDQLPHRPRWERAEAPVASRQPALFPEPRLTPEEIARMTPGPIQLMPGDMPPMRMPGDSPLPRPWAPPTVWPHGVRVMPGEAVEHVRGVVDALTAVGLVLTVEQVPLRPFAMGHHKTVVSVRPARHRS